MDKGLTIDGRFILMWCALCGLASAQQPQLTFPLIIDGGGGQVEIALTNPSLDADSGLISFLNDEGAPLTVVVGESARSTIPYSLAPGGSLKLATRGIGDLQTGYVTVQAEQPDSAITGNVVYTVNGAQVSVPPSVLSRSHHVFVERDDEVDSGIALANPTPDAVLIDLTLFDQNGRLRREAALELPARFKSASFISEIFQQMPSNFQGSLHMQSDRPFAFLGLRQRHGTDLASLAGSDRALSRGASQILFAIDTGIDLLALGLSPQVLETASVRQLTGDPSSRRSQFVHLTNSHPGRAVTIRFRYFNHECRNVLDFHLVLRCGETIVLDPFDVTVPGTGFSSRDRFFGDGTPGEAGSSPLSGSAFGDGRFVLSAVVEGTDFDEDRLAEILVPLELATDLQGQCNISGDNTGRSFGIRPDNLNICFGQPVKFNRISGFLSSDVNGECRGPVLDPSAELEAATAFTRRLTLRPTSPSGGLSCFLTDVPSPCLMIESLFEAGRTQCGNGDVGAAMPVGFEGVLFETQGN